MALLRGEKIDDYNFELWFEYFTEQGYSYEAIIEMINIGKTVKRYGSNKLAIGDLIELYNEKHEGEENKNINWTEFFRVLKIYEKKAMKDIVGLVGRHITTEEYFKHKEYLENQFEKLYGGIKSE